jgi:hypothetical protein
MKRLTSSGSRPFREAHLSIAGYRHCESGGDERCMTLRRSSHMVGPRNPVDLRTCFVASSGADGQDCHHSTEERQDVDLGRMTPSS